MPAFPRICHRLSALALLITLLVAVGGCGGGGAGGGGTSTATDFSSISGPSGRSYVASVDGATGFLANTAIPDYYIVRGATSLWIFNTVGKVNINQNPNFNFQLQPAGAGFTFFAGSGVALDPGNGPLVGYTISATYTLNLANGTWTGVGTYTASKSGMPNQTGSETFTLFPQPTGLPHDSFNLVVAGISGTAIPIGSASLASISATGVVSIQSSDGTNAFYGYVDPSDHLLHAGGFLGSRDFEQVSINMNTNLDTIPLGVTYQATLVRQKAAIGGTYSGSYDCRMTNTATFPAWQTATTGITMRILTNTPGPGGNFPGFTGYAPGTLVPVQISNVGLMVVETDGGTTFDPTTNATYLLGYDPANQRLISADVTNLVADGNPSDLYTTVSLGLSSSTTPAIQGATFSGTNDTKTGVITLSDP